MNLSFLSGPRLGWDWTTTALFVCAPLAAMLTPFPIAAQMTDNGAARTQVSVQQPGSLSKVADMDFGQIAQPANGGTVVLNPTQAATCTATNGLVRTGPCTPATFSVYGLVQGNARRVRLNGPASGAVTLNGPAGATMLMTNIQLHGAPEMTPIQGGGNANLGRYQINSGNGIATFRVGGTLHVNASQAAGVYHGTIVISVVSFN